MFYVKVVMEMCMEKNVIVFVGYMFRYSKLQFKYINCYVFIFLSEIFKYVFINVLYFLDIMLVYLR